LYAITLFDKGLIEAVVMKPDADVWRISLRGSGYITSRLQEELLNDSKQLTEKQRYLLREVVEKESIAWASGLLRLRK
jgi:ribonuclease HII